jgi:hypothetical protein
MVVTTAVLMLAVVASALLVRSQVAALGIVQPLFSWILLGAFVPAALNSASVHSDIRLGSGRVDVAREHSRAGDCCRAVRRAAVIARHLSWLFDRAGRLGGVGAARLAVPRSLLVDGAASC